MPDSPVDPDVRDAAGEEPEGGSTVGTPRWVKVSGIVVVVLVVVFVILQLLGVGGRHGPARHTPAGDTPGGPTPTSGVTTGGHTGPPPGITHP